ncbi:glycosyl transferase family 1 [Maribacter sp. 6B07]|uniref:glycosyltransferase family 4 protein n=1 Tax=Maribacter sp. 6B07 TaxID=2045442 RepID=UPI000C070070|nr:glycosyltransferase family 1 protein [Maribacter sp. 6B07]PHN94586.1 glycosyl transferase family 1 [Maribacter sp. 6B07]
MKINYFFRNPKVGYSIQRVFQTVNEKISENTQIEEIFLPSPKSNIVSIIRNGLYARKHQGKINHITGDAHYLTFFLSSKKTVITVHDIMYYSYLKGLKKKIWKSLYINSLKRAKKVVFISEFAKDQVLKELDLPKKSYCVIPNPVSSDFIKKDKKFNVEKPIILHIGAQSGRKNLGRSIAALENISCHLRIIGKMNNEIIRLLKKYNIEYSNASNLTNEEIVNEYVRSDIVNFPSLFEGFGMPIIEGQAVGRPVITSNISPMKFVAGDAAVLVNPTDIESIKLGYLKIINNELFRNEIIYKGFENVKQYQVDNIAKRYINLYKEMIK